MYFHENIFSLILVICFGGLLYPYAMKGAGSLIRLTSVYRPTSLLSSFLFALVISLQPSLGPGMLIIVPFLAMSGICCMAMELHALDQKSFDPGHLAMADIQGQVRRVRQILLGICLTFVIILLLPIDLAAVCINIMLTVGFGWAAAEAMRLWEQQRGFNLLTTLLGCGIAALCMAFRALVYVKFYGDAQNIVFPEPDAAFMPRVVASFGVVAAAIAFNYEYLGRLATQERSRAARLEEQLFATLSRILDRRLGRTADASLLLGECACLLAQKLIEARWEPVRALPHLPAILRRCAPVADIGLIGVPEAVEGLKSGVAHKLSARHPTIGETFFQAIHAGRRRAEAADTDREALGMASEIAGNYAEHWDGSGVPHGRLGEEIPVAARIVAVARAYVDAAVGAQSGNGHMSGLHHVRAGRGTHFDPTIVDVLLAAEAEIAALYDSFG